MDGLPAQNPQRPSRSHQLFMPLGIALHKCTPNFGGPIAPAGGLVFVGAAMDGYPRAFDARSGAELWRGRLPAAEMATPMTYVWAERQYVVIAVVVTGRHEPRRQMPPSPLPCPRPKKQTHVVGRGRAAGKASGIQAQRPQPAHLGRDACTPQLAAKTATIEEEPIPNWRTGPVEPTAALRRRIWTIDRLLWVVIRGM